MEEKKNPVDLKRIFQSLQRMPLLFEKTASLEENVRCLAVFLQNFVPVCRVALVLTDTQLRWKDIAVWEQPSLLSSSSFAGWLHKAWQESVESRPGGEGAAELESQLKKSGQAAVFPRYVEKSQTSVLNVLLWKEESCGSWLPKEREMVCLFGELLDKSPSKQQRPGQDVWRSILDSVASSIYITDPDTDKILFMNRTMREAYQIDRPEGKICWQVLQKGEEGRCGFCPVKELMEHRGEPLVLRWEETSPITGRLYENYDSLIPWTDGSLAHFQHSVDVTDSRKMYHVASMDELSGMLSRRAGKEALQKAFLQARFEQVPLTVVMYDLNMLKEVNDVYGHQEGDRLISMTSEEVRRCLGPHDIAFRLSGDEFILALPGRSREAAKHRMNHVLEQLELRRREEGVPYECSFCFGAVEADLSGEFDLTGLLTLADEKMYLQKRRYHIKKREKEFQRGLARPSGHPDEFRYDIRQFYDALVQSTDDYIYVCDMKTDTFRYPKSMVEEFDLPGEVIHNAAAAWAEKIHEHDKQAFLEANQEVADGRAEGHSVEYRAKNRQGEWVWLRCRGHLERDENGEPTLFAGIISNLGKKNRIDHMTGLFNKFEFETDVRRLLERGAQHRMAILILGMDDFRRVNDLYNREFGDEVLRITAQKIQTLLPGNASVYRLDGDEFGVVFQGGGRERIVHFYAALKNHFRYQQECNGKKYYSTLSAGCVCYPQDALDYLELMKYAHYSLEYSKNNGKNRITFFTRDILKHKEKSLELTELLRAGSETGFRGFSLVYQPQVRAEDGGVTGAEALMRWQCEKYGAVPPSEFIPLLEQSGLIIPVGKWVFRQAVRQCRRWAESRPDFVMSINLSYLQAAEPDFISFMKNVLEEEGVRPKNIVVEFTESSVAQGSVRGIFRAIRSLGLKIAMDDFGTGYSSLGILKDAPADIVKIDKTFIRDIKTSSFDATFISFIVALCHDVGIQVCLEGVETEEEYQIVRSMDLDTIQGYFYGRPVSVQEFEMKYL